MSRTIIEAEGKQLCLGGQGEKTEMSTYSPSGSQLKDVGGGLIADVQHGSDFTHIHTAKRHLLRVSFNGISSEMSVVWASVSIKLREGDICFLKEESNALGIECRRVAD